MFFMYVTCNCCAQVMEFLATELLRDAVELKTARMMLYPNITLCNTLFFSKDKMEGRRLGEEGEGLDIVVRDLQILSLT